MPGSPGTYALVLQLTRPTHIDVGRLGRLSLAPGFYVYVGSAFGAGGLRARVERHWSGRGRPHWHVDYLRAVSRPVAVWYQVQQSSREHDWAAALARGRGLQPVPGFGCSDCRCGSHLYHAASAPSFDAFRRRLGRRKPGDGALQRL
ncbi:MAG: GIY-YIG nuclease family protein [Chromatiales bacterium]|nr:MAG: GIY-YIG nuclease family protein [Chromatiales bacterium]